MKPQRGWIIVGGRIYLPAIDPWATRPGARTDGGYSEGSRRTIAEAPLVPPATERDGLP